ncbi:hypothetical protein [Bradyrhizobium archetypum]|uniref:Uncharacterized protein n=1 Tax=Bradyrhizobium archetypum TaxID=2721160 RepID=A0A7Y4H5I8_9BRAD|nr:hypothetical protein [Bradyrhizobium archetypum]NOJ47990.1 hypothetical protein [Bradyrhizobium archetypum]
MKQLPGNQQFPDKLSTNDLRAYRRWIGGLYLSYLAATIIAVGLMLANGPPRDLSASNEIQVARLKGGPAVPAAAKHVTRP